MKFKNKDLEAIIANLQSAVMITDKKGTILTMNKTARKIFNWCKCTNKNQTACLPYLKTLDGDELCEEDSPFHLPLNGKKYTNYLLESQSPKTGKKVIFNFHGTPLKNDKNKINGSVVMFQDATEAYRLQERLRRMVNYEKIKSSHLSILHEVSLSLNKEKSISKILQIVLDAAVTITEAKTGIILKKEKNYQITENFSADEDDKTINDINITALKKLTDNKLFKDNNSLRIANFSKLSRNTKTKPSSIKALISSPIIIDTLPIVNHLILVNKKNSRRFSFEDEKVTQILCSHAAVAIDNAVNYKREHHIAQVLQKSLLPSSSFAKSLNPNIDVSLVYKSATQEALVGGDLYDFFEVGKGRTACLIADVNGKGVKAAAITSLVKSTIKAFAYEGFSVDKVLEKTNKVLVNQTDPSVFITAILGVLDLQNGLFEYANAGHHPPLIYRYKENGIITLNQGSTPLGLLANEHYDLHIIDLHPNDCLTLYTDGLVEARNKKIFYGEDRLMKCLLKNALLPDIADKILADVEQFSNGNLTDDIALIALKLKSEINPVQVETAVSLWS